MVPKKQVDRVGSSVGRPLKTFAATAVVGSLATGAQPESLTTKWTNNYGTPGGLMDMPTAEMAPEGEISTAFSGFAGQVRSTFSFQVTPRLSGSFRYTATKGLIPRPGEQFFATYYDRSFDLRYRLLDETATRPAVAVGLQDFIGTGLLGGEYIVATKSVGPKLRVTGGIGWGRLGSYNNFATMGTRPEAFLGEGGIPTYNHWFRGPVAGFAGFSYDINDRLSVKAEYSSDAYTREVGDGIFERKSPINIGLDYKLGEGSHLSLYAMHGSEIGANFTFTLNARTPTVRGGIEEAPLPVAVRSRTSAAELGWSTDETRTDSIRQAVATSLKKEGIDLHGLQLTDARATVLIRNGRFDMRSQAIGRTTRVLTRTLPSSVETFTIAQVVDGMPTSAVTVNRSDVERLEYEPASDMFAAASFTDGYGLDRDIPLAPDVYPRFNWALAPYVALTVFDPDSPVRANTGLRLKGNYHIAPGWVASGSVSYRLGGNIEEVDKPSDSKLPAVRSDIGLYSQAEGPVIDRLSLARYSRLGPDLYGRITAGYLEQMYAGVSGEVLWKPVDSRLALGAEANYVKQRDFDQQFGLQDYEVATGHLSAYYDFGNGFHGQVDAGRYLAGDWGVTVALDREFANGWRIGAYATKTNVSAEDFGEGSFDKGIRIRIPLSWITGKPMQRVTSTTIQSLSRDGGAKLRVDGRLYDEVRETHQPELAKTWGKFWR